MLSAYIEKFKKVPFESSCYETPQFKAFFNGFKKSLKADLEGSGIELANISKGHFTISGFLKRGEKFVYFSVRDVRDYDWHRQVLYRTAKSNKDYTGGQNRYCSFGGLVKSCERLLG